MQIEPEHRQNGILEWIVSRPTLLDFLSASLIVWLFLAGPNGWDALLSDGDTGWHIRAGDWIREHGQLPRQDIFSFSKAGHEWFAWEWMAEILFSLLHQWAGLKGVVLFCGMLLPTYLLIVFRHMLWRGTSPLLALAVLFMTAGCSAIHYLARPHLFTLVFLSASLFLLDLDARSPRRSIWLLIPLTALWVNLHGGFLALPACIACYCAASLISKDAEKCRRYLLLLAGCATASLINPYGLELHRHIFAYLRSDWIREVVDEFQSPRFRSEAMLYFEVLLLASAAACAGLSRQKRWADVLLILLWGHLSLGAVRHVPIFLVVAAPRMAGAFSDWWQEFVSTTGKRSVWRTVADLSADLRPGFVRSSFWISVPLIVLVLLEEPVRWPRNFPVQKFPVSLIESHRTEIEGRRVLATDEWGDYLLYRFPRVQRVFFDGRSDFFGPEVGNDYLALMNGSPRWRAIVDRYRFDAVLIPPSWPLAALLTESGQWSVTANTTEAVLLVPKTSDLPAGLSRGDGSKEFFSPPLMKTTILAERKVEAIKP